MSNLVKHAELELKKAGYFDDGLYGGELGKAVLELVKKFSEQGHSGMSAGITLKAFNTVASWEPLGPLTGDDDEWTEVSEGLWQNKRFSRVFKDKDGAYDTEGRVFIDTDGVGLLTKDSRVPVTFPYTPNTEYVHLAELSKGDGEK